MHQSESQPEAPATADQTDRQICRMIGLARRAGRVISGSEAVIRALQQKKAALLVLACDASERTKRQLVHVASQCQVPVVTVSSKADLGHWTGTQERAVLAITDRQLAGHIRDLAGNRADEAAQ